MKSNKILYIVCILIIIVGCILIKVKGVNYSIDYEWGNNIEIYFDKETSKSEIEEISKEVFGKDTKVNEIERFSDAFSIKVKDISDEQKNDFITKINEKYTLEKIVDDLIIVEVPRVSGIDLIKQYIKPAIISLAVIFVYLSIRYKNIGNVKTALLTIIKTGIITGAYFGLVFITRMPIVNMYVIPVGLAIAVIALFTICYKNEIEIKKLKEEEK